MIVANEVASLYPTAICIRILDVDEGGMYKIEKPVTINELIHNEWINPLYWGDLFIDTNGNVLCNEKQIIGNILKWDEIKFHKLIEKGSLWRATRKQFHHCSKCLFRNICPPLSGIELYNKETYCKMRPYHFRS